MVIRSRGDRQAEDLCVAHAEDIPVFLISCVESLDPVRMLRRKMNIPDIARRAERMGLNDAATRAVNLFKLLLPAPLPDLRMLQEPLLVQPVNEIVVSLVGFLPAEKNREVPFQSLIQRVLIP